MQKRLLSGLLFLITIITVSQADAAAPDGSGPWADTVVSTSQGLDKSGDSIPAIRSDASQALGVAEETEPDGTFYSLGFGGSITLGFDTPFNSQVIVIETTRTDEYYPKETALVEVSADNVNWITAGTVTQNGEVAFPEDIDCAAYIRITDTSDPSIFQDATADGYDVDGVKTLGEKSCQIDTEVEPTPSPTPSTTPSSNTTTTNNDTPNSNPGYTCDNPKPSAPTLTANRTSSTTVELRWNSVNNATHYAISYGTSAGNYAYGVANTGNTTSFTIGGLAPNTTYYFIVRAVNDCQPGDASNEVNSGSGGQILGLTSDTSTNSSSRSQILGLSTESLAATGTKAELARISVVVLSGLATGLFVFTRLHVSKQ